LKIDIEGDPAVKRCRWCDENSPEYVAYHDHEWGVPCHDDGKLFEMLVLEGMQAGLSWLTVLKKRDNFRKAFDSFDYNKISRYGESKIEKLMADPGIIRNRLKIRSVVQNARVFMEIQKETGSFDRYLWAFVDFKQVRNSFKNPEDIPANTEISDRISRDLKKRGMNFVGSTIIYAYMQAVGMVNDHETGCFRHGQV